MSSDSEDEDLRKAIALSLQGQNGTSIENAIDLDDPESAGELAPRLGAERTTSHSKIEPSPATGLRGLDRRQMEAERLDRLKRKRQTSLSPSVPLAVRPMHTTPTWEILDAPSAPAHFRAEDGDKTVHSHGEFPVYSRGVLKKTHVVRHEKTDATIDLEEVLDSQHLQLAVLSSFQWDIPWLFSKLENSRTLVTLIMEAKDEETKAQYRRETAGNHRLRLCFPPMDAGPGCMHSKLMLLSYPGYLRIAIPTANLVAYDWGETGVMENMVFLIDLPRLSKDPQQQFASEEMLTPFGQQLFRFLQAMNLESSIAKSLLKFDFSATRDLAFVHTIGGSNIGANNPWRYTGHCGLANAVKDLHLTTQEPVGIDYVTSSIGAIEHGFLTRLYRACQGHSSAEEAEGPNAKRRLKGRSDEKQTPDLDLDSHLRLYFPTKATIDVVGVQQAGTICLQSKWYDAPAFPRQLFRNCESVRSKVLMHNKLLLVRQPPVDSNSSPGTASGEAPSKAPIAVKKWAYLGSANCSESAWGNKVTRDRKTGMQKMYCRNWECGVLFPAEYPDNADILPSHRTVTGRDEGRADPAKVQSTAEDPSQAKSKDGDDGSRPEDQRTITVPIPMVFPGKKYGPGDRPWLYDDQR